MRRLFTIDLKDYNPNGEKLYRPSVRGIIFDSYGNVAMIYSQKYHFYKFPGGGIEDGETRLQTLAREIKEAIAVNAAFQSNNTFHKQIAERDKRVLEILHMQDTK